MAEDIVGKVISLFSGDKTVNMSDKEIVLQQRLKELGENKYTSFFRPKTEEADIPLAQFFHSLYSTLLPMRGFMKDTAKMVQLRQVVMEAFLDPAIVDTIRRLNPNGIEERAATTPSMELVAEIRADIAKLGTGFNSARINGVNRCHNMIMIISHLVNFDYPTILKKFDPNFTDGPFSVPPKFSPVKLDMIARELGEFLVVAHGVIPDSDWKTLLKLLKICAKEELISETQFAQMLIGLRDILNSKILILMVQYGSRNPVWTCKPRIPDEHVAEAWVEAKTLKAQACIETIKGKEKKQQIDGLVKKIFDSDELIVLENYTPAAGLPYRKRELTDFAYAEGLNYLSSFLSGGFDKEVCELLLIRGQWTNNASSKEMSEALHQVMELAGPISALDEELSLDGTDGSRLKVAINRVDRDSTQIRHINTIVGNINDGAQEILEHATQHFSVIAKHMKSMVEDIQKKHPELIVNWRELSSVSKEPILPLMEKETLKIHNFVQLMGLCSQ